MSDNIVNKSIIKIIGLLGDLPKKSDHHILQLLKKNGYEVDCFPSLVLSDGSTTRNDESIGFLKDYFYSDFRKIMFLEDENIKNTRLCSTHIKEVILVKDLKDESGNISQKYFPVNIKETEVYLFPSQIGLFSITLDISDKLTNYHDINDILFLIRHFDTLTSENLKWHEWISKNVLAGIELRGDNIKTDEFSGSKFKLYTILDCKAKNDERAPLLYDMATVSRIGTALSTDSWAPSKQYYDKLMLLKISPFNNWEALCLFDSFTCIGDEQLNNAGSFMTWDYTYFRIYLYRLFFKYNLYKYNSSIQEEPVKLRTLFETFLNDYNFNRISYNFLANEIYIKAGEALEIDIELLAFQARLNHLTNLIQEKRETKTNNLLQLVTVLGGISSVQPVLGILDHFKKYLGWSSYQFYSSIIVLLLLCGVGILFYLMPDLLQKLITRFRKNASK